MLPVLRAEETLDSIQTFACGSGNLKKEVQSKLFRQLEKQSKVVKDPLGEAKQKPVNYAALSMIIPVVDTRKTKK
jgi:hypothetical protein